MQVSVVPLIFLYVDDGFEEWEIDLTVNIGSFMILEEVLFDRKFPAEVDPQYVILWQEQGQSQLQLS